MNDQRDTDHTDDVQRMLAFQQGDEEAFVALYRKYRDRMVNFTRRFLGDQAQAEEAAQEVFLKLYKARARYEPKSKFSTFLYRIATNHCLNQRARHDVKLTDRGVVAEEHAHVEAGQAQAAEAAEMRRALSAALAKLPDNQRAALLLCHYEGMSYEEAAAAIELSVSAVKSLIHRARERLMKDLQPLMSEASHAL